MKTKFNALHSDTDFIKFNSTTGWINISRVNDSGYNRKKVGIILDPKSVDALIEELKAYQTLCIQ